jgi:hypothetical protein
MRFVSTTAALAASAIVASAGATTLSVTIENTFAPGGLSFSPFWIAAHDGSFDVYDSGVSAALFPGVEEIAELADTGPISTAFSNSSAGMNGGAQTTVVSDGGPPPFTPGESTTVSFDTVDPTTNRWFSYASMVVPSNDLFVANGDPLAIELFDAAGNFNGPVTIEIFGSEVLDAGTEVNDATNGGAFIQGVDIAGGETEDGVIRAFFSLSDADDYLDSLVGLTTPPGDQITSTFGRDTLIARITIVPAPAGVALFGAAGALAGVRRRR